MSTEASPLVRTHDSALDSEPSIYAAIQKCTAVGRTIFGQAEPSILWLYTLYTALLRALSGSGQADGVSDAAL